ncbi:MAG: ABC transporter permease subunit [Eubacteriales bacterium]
MKTKKLKYTFGLIFLNIVFIIICFATVVPIFYAFSLSFSSSSSMFISGFSLMPETPTLQNYVTVLTEEPFLMWLKNSTILSVGTMILAMGTSITAAYGFSRYRFKGRLAILKSLLILNAFPQILSMFAIFRVFRTINLINTFLGLVIIYSGSMCIFAIWNMKGYFDSIPIEIEEAAMVDGAGEGVILRKIILPLARPAILVTAVMVIIFVWNEYLFSTTFILDEGKYALAGGLYQLQAGDYNTSWPLFTAASILVSMPILIIFFCIQKYMVSGLTAGGVKG